MLNLFSIHLDMRTLGAAMNPETSQGFGGENEVGSFCCPVLPEPLESPSVARWGPTAL